MDLAEMAELMALIRDRTVSKFNDDWNSFIDFLWELDKNDVKS